MIPSVKSNESIRHSHGFRFRCHNSCPHVADHLRAPSGQGYLVPSPDSRHFRAQYLGRAIALPPPAAAGRHLN